MKSKIIFKGLAIAVVVVATALVVLDRGQETDVRDQVPEVSNQISEVGSQKSELFKQRVLASPEEFQTQVVEIREAPVPLTVPTNRPVQLSEVDKPVREKVQKEPVAASDLYFWKDYQSMRKEEIRNPDSEANRQGVVALLQARQRRAEQDR